MVSEYNFIHFYYIKDPTGVSVTFVYDTTETYSLSSNQDILVLALPHHYTSLKNSKQNLPWFKANYNCVKGDMIPVVGKLWTVYERLKLDICLKTLNRPPPLPF